MHLFIVFIILISKVSDGRINTRGPTIVKEFVNCVSSLIKKDFQEPGLLIFGISYDSSSIVEKLREQVLKYIHESNNFVIQTVDPSKIAVCKKSDINVPGGFHLDLKENKHVRTANYFVVIANNAEDFFQFASKIIKAKYWNPDAKFIVFLCHLINEDNVKRMVVQEILSYLFKHNVMKVVVGTVKDHKMRKVLIYSWRPYDPPKYCGYDNETNENRLELENICENGILKFEKSVFYNRVPNNMYGCNMYMLALERQPFISRNMNDPNMEKVMVNELLKKTNFSINYQIINAFRGERNESGKWSGALKELVSKKGHVLLGGIFPDFDVHEDFECSLTYLSDSYAWVVPRAYSKPPWIALTITFQEHVWYLTVVGFFICVITWNFFGRISCDTKYNKSLMHCFMNTWISSLGFSSYVRPVQQSLRVFNVFLNIYNILLLTAYQTKLIDVLLNPTFEYQIHTLEELIDSRLNFGGSEELHDLFYNSSDTFDHKIGENWIHINNISKALIDVVVNRNFSVLCSRLELAHLSAVIPELTDDLGQDNYYVFKTNAFTVPIEMIALKGFPFMKNISRTLSIYKQLGLNSMLRRYFTSLNMKKRAKLFKKSGNNKNLKALSMKHLQGGFFILAIGNVAGIVILILEIILNSNYIKYK
ncbi:uncharacterized protein LOC116766944, partial [Danaus plexippus]|uniref:uncharacterized protein LOC116766944 n=1 Tax=Danaus plexippus TaxID=13037 RepID=UPI002AB0C8AC